MDGEPKGCLGFILELLGVRFGGSEKSDQTLPYRQRDNFLSPAELAFFRVLEQVASGHFHVCAKVRISDLLYVVQRNQNIGHANRIDRKHVDFVLCRPDSMQPALVVELDDVSHQRKDRHDRDAFVDAAFAAAGLPVLHVPCRQNYDVETLKQQIRLALGQRQNPVEEEVLVAAEEAMVAAEVVEEGASQIPECPKCNIPMVERKAARGKHAGKRFWACSSYPECRKIIPID